MRQIVSSSGTAVVHSSAMVLLVGILLSMRTVNAWVPASTSALLPWSPPLRPHSGIVHRTGQRRSPYLQVSSDSSSSDDVVGLNELQTLLRDAVASERYGEAARLRDELRGRVSGEHTRLSWTGLGTAPWLVARLEALDLGIPTTIQVHTMESVNGMLDGDDVNNRDALDDYTLERRLATATTPTDLSVVVSGSTGSGKTHAFLVPLLSTLSESLFLRQRLRVQAEEDVGDALDDVLARVAVTTSPSVSGRGRSQVGGGGSGVGLVGAALSTLGKGDREDVRSPLALIVVPTRELGVQTAMALYRLVGGSVKRSALDLSGKSNMFKYQGPKGVRIGCILDQEEAASGLKLQTDVAVTTPKFLGKLMRDGDVNPSKLRVLVFDEADLALEVMEEEVMQVLFGTNMNSNSESNSTEQRSRSRLTYLVGASVTEALADLPVKDKILPKNTTYIATATSFSPLKVDDTNNNNNNDDDVAPTSSTTTTTTLKQLRLNSDAGLRHERCLTTKNTGLLTLCRLLRSELKEYARAYEAYSLANTTNTTTDEADATTTITPSPPPPAKPRVIVFFPDEASASAAMPKLRDAMWGDHKLCLLLPETGFHPLAILEQFRNDETDVMLATSDSVRGLDIEGLTHVYALYLPEDAREYLHLAGRVGRIGQTLGGGGGGTSSSGINNRVTSVLDPDDAARMERLAETLGFDFVDVSVDEEESVGMGAWKRGELKDDDDEEEDDDEEDYFEGANVEDMRRYLEDTVTLLGDGEDPEIGTGDTE